MSPTRRHSGDAPEIPTAERFESWKEIAAYLQRDESTLRRWAVRKGFPVHKRRVKSKITVYAVKSEIDAWLCRRGGELEGVARITTTISTAPLPEPEPALEAPPKPPTETYTELDDDSPIIESPAVRSISARARWLAVPVVLAFIGATALAVGYMDWSTSANALAPRIDSLAVLPLTDVSPDATEDYFADGLTELLTSDLGEIKRLRVIEHASMRPYKSARKPLVQMAEDLNVDAVVEGSLLRSRDRVRLTLRLIDAKRATLIWTNTYERESRDVLALPRQFAQAMVSQVMPQHELRRLDNSPLAADVSEAYLRGNYYVSRLSCEGLSLGLTDFQQVAAGAPNYAQAHARLASTYLKLADFGCVPSRVVVARARAAAVRALALDPDLGEAHAVLGVISYLYDWDWWSAQSELKRAIELNPNDAMAHAWYGTFLFSTGKQAEALVQFSRARNIDPVPGAATLVYGYTLYHYRWYDRAIEQFQRVVELYPDSAPAYFGMAAAYERKRMRNKALKNYLKARELSGATSEIMWILSNAAHSGGLAGYWQKELALANAQADTCRSSLSAAHIGAPAQMLNLLERAYDARCSNLASLKVDPLYDRLRREPRFVNIIKRMGLPIPDSQNRKPASARSAEKLPETTV